MATSAVPHHLPDDMQVKAFFLGKRCKKTSLFSPFQKIQTNGVKSGRFLHRLVRSCGCLGQASGQVLHGHLHDTDRITLKISHLNSWQYNRRFRQHGHRRRLLYCVSVSGVTYCNINPESYLSNFRGQCHLFTLLFLCPPVRKEIPVGFDWSPVRHFSHPVEQVGEIFKEVDAMQPAGTCQ